MAGYLSLAAALAVHGLASLGRGAARGQAVDANLWSRHCKDRRLRDLGGHVKSWEGRTRRMSGGRLADKRQRRHDKQRRQQQQ